MSGEKDKNFVYSNKLLGRLGNIYDRCQLTLVGGEFHGQKAKSRHFGTTLPTLFEGEVGSVPAFNVRLPQVLERTLLLGEQGVNYIDGLGGSDFKNIPELATQVALGKNPSTVIRLVYGATTEMPFRGLSYLLPPLAYMENTQDLISQLQVIFANNISSRLDHLDTKTAFKEAKTFADLAQDYIRTFCPDLADKVVFLEDTPLDQGSDLRNRLLTLTASLKRLAPEDILDDLVRKAVNNGGGHTYNYYGAAHVLFHDIDIPGSLVPILPDQSKVIAKPDVIVSIGGKKEEVFYRLRHVLKPHLDPEYATTKTLQFFTRHFVPPYYMARGGDISVNQVLIQGLHLSTAVATAARYDLDFLERVSNGQGDFEEFIELQRGKAV